jgi:hypothetical protein
VPIIVTQLPFYLEQIISQPVRLFSQTLKALTSEQDLQLLISRTKAHLDKPAIDNHQSQVNKFVYENGLDKLLEQRIRNNIAALRTANIDDLMVSLNYRNTLHLCICKTQKPRTNFEVYFDNIEGRFISNQVDEIKSIIPSSTADNPNNRFFTFVDDLLTLKEPFN